MVSCPWIGGVASRHPRPSSKEPPLSAHAPWSPPPKPLRLATNEVHIWRFPLTPPPLDAAEILSPAELERAARFRFERDQHQYVTGHVNLRRILARYLPQSAAAIAFRTEAKGKPYVEGTQVRFNMADSDGLGLVGIALNREIGVDLERVRDNVEHHDIAQQFFTAREQSELSAHEGAARRDAFFHVWAQKEAYLKARGDGLTVPLKDFSVSCDVGVAGVLERHDEDGESHRWEMLALAVAPDYAAAVCVEGSGWSLRAFDFGEANP